MAREVEWTETSIQDRFKIYKFWRQHNKSNLYSERLELLFKNAAQLISEFPDIGVKTNTPNVRFKVIKDYKLFYQTDGVKITILTLWYSKNDPSKLKIGK
jgi:hypothetical protein